MATGRKFDISLGLDVGSAISASDRMIAKQKEVAAAALAAANAQEAAHRRSSQQMQAMYTAVFSQVAAGAAQMGMDIARAGAQAVDAATDKQKQVSAKFSGTRGDLRELAQLNNKTLGADYVREVAERNVRMGMTPQEGTALFTQAFNTGAQFISDDPNAGHMTRKDSATFFEKVGRFARARGVPARDAGDLAGLVLGFKDYRKEKDPIGAAMQTVAQVTGILDAGRGDLPVLLQNFAKVAAGSLDESGEDRGTFTTAAQVATAVSTAAQKDPGRSGAMVQQAAKVMREFNNPLVKAAGIKPTDPFETMIRKLEPVVLAQADKFGLKPEDVLKHDDSPGRESGFTDRTGGNAVAGFVMQGVKAGIFDQRARVGATATTASVDARIAAFEASKEGIAGVRAAEGELEDVKRGQASESMTVLRQEAINQLRAEGSLDTTTSEFREGLSKGLSRGLLPSNEQHMIDERVREIVNKRLPSTIRPVRSFQADLFETADNIAGSFMNWAGVETDLGGNFVPTNESKTDLINQAEAQAAKLGISILRDPTPQAIPSGTEPKYDGR